jgi:hypothetical protein
MDKCVFEVEVNYASNNDRTFTNVNYSENDLKNFITLMKRYKYNFVWGRFILTSPKSDPIAFIKNIDVVLEYIGAAWFSTIDIVEYTRIENNRLCETYSTPYKVNPEIRAKVEEYFTSLDSWLKGENLRRAISKHKCYKETLEEVYSILEIMDQRKKDQVLSLKDALERLLEIIN